MSVPEGLHRPEQFTPVEKINEHVLEKYEALKVPLEELGKANPAVADCLVDLYKRVLEELIARVTVGYKDGARIKRLSAQRSDELSSALARIEVDLPTFG